MKDEIAHKIKRSVFPGIFGGPHNNKIGAIALALGLTQTESFKKTQEQIVKNARALASRLTAFGFRLVGGGTETHLMLVDLRKQGVSGQEAQNLLEQANIVVNRNSIPSDTSPFNPSGLRPGTPSITFRNMKEKQAEQIADWFEEVLIKKQEPAAVREQVKALCQKFPTPYGD